MDYARLNITRQSVDMMVETVRNSMRNTLTVLEIVLVLLEMGFVMAVYIMLKSVVMMAETVLSLITNTRSAMLTIQVLKSRMEYAMVVNTTL